MDKIAARTGPLLKVIVSPIASWAFDFHASEAGARSSTIKASASAPCNRIQFSDIAAPFNNMPPSGLSGSRCIPFFAAKVMLVGAANPRASQPHNSNLGSSTATITAGDMAPARKVRWVPVTGDGQAYSLTKESDPGVSTNPGALSSTNSASGLLMMPPKLSWL